MRPISIILLAAFSGDALTLSLLHTTLGPLITTAGVATALLVPRQPEPAQLAPRQLGAGAVLGSSRALAGLGGSVFTADHSHPRKVPDLIGAVRSWLSRKAGNQANDGAPVLPAKGGEVIDLGSQVPIEKSRGRNQIDAVPPMTPEEELELLAMSNGRFKWCMRCYGDIYSQIWVG